MVYGINWMGRLFGHYPNYRCPTCKTLYAIFYNRKENVGERNEWRSVTECGRCVSATTERWQTWDDVTTKTTYGDGHTSSKTVRENVQNHSHTTRRYEYHEYDVYYHVTDYRHFYKCAVCGFEESDVREELKELDRKFKRTYVQ